MRVVPRQTLNRLQRDLLLRVLKWSEEGILDDWGAFEWGGGRYDHCGSNWVNVVWRGVDGATEEEK